MGFALNTEARPRRITLATDLGASEAHGVIASSLRIVRGPLGTLLGAWLLASTGGWAFTIGIAVYAFDRSGAGAVGLVTAARLLPAVLAAPLSGALIDRAGRTAVVVGACALQAACIAVAAALVAGHAVLWPIIVTAAISGAVATAPRPALETLLPALASTPDELVRATAAWSGIDNAGFLLGGGAGGASIALLGAGAVISIAAGLFAVAAILALGLPRVRATEEDEAEEESSALAEALAGLRALASAPLLRTAFVLLAAVLLVEGTTDVQLVDLAIGRLRMGSGGPGLLYACWGVGGILGGRRAAGGGQAPGLRTGAAGRIAGAFAIGIGVSGAGGVPVAVLAMLPAGLGFALVEAAVMALVPRLADDVIAGRVYALAEVLYAGAAGAGALLAPSLIRALGVSGSLAAAGGAVALLALAVSRMLARLDAGSGGRFARPRAASRRELPRAAAASAPRAPGAQRGTGERARRRHHRHRRRRRRRVLRNRRRHRGHRRIRQAAGPGQRLR